MHILATVGIAIVVFASTNIDDIFLLSALFADHKMRPRNIVIGQFLGIGMLVLVSACAAFASLLIPAGWMGLLGIIPFLLGVRGLFQMRSKPDEEGAEEEKALEEKLHSQVLAVAGITIANGGDNLGVYIPLFAKEPSTIGIYAIVFAVMTLVWCFAGYALVKNRWVGPYVETYGKLALPFVLIGLGLYILSDIRILF